MSDEKSFHMTPDELRPLRPCGGRRAHSQFLVRAPLRKDNGCNQAKALIDLMMSVMGMLRQWFSTVRASSGRQGGRERNVAGLVEGLSARGVKRHKEKILAPLATYLNSGAHLKDHAAARKIAQSRAVHVAASNGRPV